MIKKLWYGEFPGYPVVRIQCFHSWGPALILGQETKILQAVRPKKKKKDIVCVYTHTMEYYSVKKKNKILQSVATWMDLEGFMLSEIGKT